jgi:uncharacterized DUF497 family protein
VAALRFAWDREKAKRNLEKHGVAFAEAETVFYDEHALQIDDPDESVGEERFLMLGLSGTLRILAVCHCVRAGGDDIRIISARKAVKAEQKQYWERLKR